MIKTWRLYGEINSDQQTQLGCAGISLAKIPRGSELQYIAGSGYNYKYVQQIEIQLITEYENQETLIYVLFPDRLELIGEEYV